MSELQSPNPEVYEFVGKVSTATWPDTFVPVAPLGTVKVRVIVRLCPGSRNSALGSAPPFCTKSHQLPVLEVTLWSKPSVVSVAFVEYGSGFAGEPNGPTSDVAAAHADANGLVTVTLVLPPELVGERMSGAPQYGPRSSSIGVEPVVLAVTLSW